MIDTFCDCCDGTSWLPHQPSVPQHESSTDVPAPELCPVYSACFFLTYLINAGLKKEGITGWCVFISRG